MSIIIDDLTSALSNTMAALDYEIDVYENLYKHAAIQDMNEQAMGVFSQAIKELSKCRSDIRFTYESLKGE